MHALIYVGDALWVISLTVMVGASRAAWARMEPDTRVPMQFRPDGSPLWRAKPRTALWALPAAAFVVSLLLVVFNRNVNADPSSAFILFGVRATAAALFALAHLRWLKGAMHILEQEGALKS